MKKKLIAFLLVVCLCASLLPLGASALAADDRPGNTSVETPSAVIDGDVHEGTLEAGNTYFVYVPKCDDYGGRATSSPILIVYGDKAYTAETAKATAISSGLAAIADHERGPVIFLNPVGDTWAAGDQAAYLEVKALFSNTSTEDFAHSGKSSKGFYPGMQTRIYVFAEGAGADFAYTYLAPGIFGPAQFFGTAVWKPVSLFLMNPASTQAIDLEEYAPGEMDGRKVPVCIVNGDDAVVNSFRALNDEDGMTVSVTSSVTEGFDKAALIKAYDDLLEHWVTRDMARGVTLLEITDTDKIGVSQKRVDYKFSDGKIMTYYSYIPDGVSEKLPLIVTFHGSGNTAEYQVWTSGFLRMLEAGEEFILLSIDDYNRVYTKISENGIESVDDEATNAAIVQLIDSFIASSGKVDASRVYLSGFSMGSARSQNLGSEYTSKFAGLMGMNLFTGVSDNKTGLILPAFIIGGEESYIRAIEFPSAANPLTAQYFLRANGVTNSYAFNDKYTFGMESDRIYETDSTDFGDMTLTVHEFAANNGIPFTAFASNSYCGHEPSLVATQTGWDFIKQFSRRADGTIAVNGNGAYTTLSAGDYAYPAYDGGEGLSNFSEDTAEYKGFKDVDDKNSWYGDGQYGYIRTAVSLGIMAGDAGTDTFRPMANVKISEALKVAAVIHNIYSGGDGEFNITQGAHWPDVFVNYCFENGIIKSTDFLNVNAYATRGQIAYIFARCLPAEALAAINDIAKIPDCDENTANYADILALYKAGILAGDADSNNFRPGSNITRAEISAMVGRLCVQSARMEFTIN